MNNNEAMQILLSLLLKDLKFNLAPLEVNVEIISLIEDTLDIEVIKNHISGTYHSVEGFEVRDKDIEAFNSLGLEV